MNLYWPVYENIESSFEELTYHIHIDDEQLNVYSSKIIDLVLRAASEIESISKELYKLNGGTEKQFLKYDEDAIKFLNSKFQLDAKLVTVSHTNCFLSQKVLYPFKKDTKRANSNGVTYSWNVSYQNLKHNRAENLQYGSIRYLIDIMAALYILNIYYKNISYNIDSSYRPKNFDTRLGSKIFSINLSVSAGDSIKGIFWKNKDFEESVYIVKMKNESFTNFVESVKKEEKETLEAIIADKRFQDCVQQNNITDVNQNFWVIIKATGIDINQFSKPKSNYIKYLEYEAVLNKNQFDENPYDNKGYKSIFGLQGNATPDTNPNIHK